MPDREAAKRIFMAALDLDPAERPAFIAGQCKGDAALQREVEALLAAHDGKPILDPATLPAQPPNNASPKSKNIAGSARAGEEIGPYRLLERIGEGGFGEVWIAEQKTPVRRKVALKIIKAGMDTREVLARFEAERQALAVMDHPNVAKVFDAGATSGGRPYFVMEYVAGLPINAYCDSAKLRIKERLRLFMNICHAVQHAHQKGIIHRDLKPGNIIVTLQDGKPVPKVIDFGIAKATVGRLTERTLYTETGRVIGTPEYMAPEQAGTSGLDVDTRADIYSLGVILYELLTGTLPLDGHTLRSAGIEAVGRMLNEFEPPKPSTRLSTLVNEPVTRGRAEPATIAKTHGADLRTLQRELRGDLDWITLKALEKDRTRRYETASAFAADVDRHLTGEPVIAAPPSMGYRVRKFVRKHRGRVVATSAMVIVLLAGIATTTWQFIKARNANAQLIAQKALGKQVFEQIMIKFWEDSFVSFAETSMTTPYGEFAFSVNYSQAEPTLTITKGNESAMFCFMESVAVELIQNERQLSSSLEVERNAATEAKCLAEEEAARAEAERDYAISTSEKLRALVARATAGFEKVANEFTAQERLAQLIIPPGKDFSGTTRIELSNGKPVNFRIFPEYPDDDASAADMLDQIVDAAIRNIKRSNRLTKSLERQSEAAENAVFESHRRIAQLCLLRIREQLRSRQDLDAEPVSVLESHFLIQLNRFADVVTKLEPLKHKKFNDIDVVAITTLEVDTDPGLIEVVSAMGEPVDAWQVTGFLKALGFVDPRVDALKYLAVSYSMLGRYDEATELLSLLVQESEMKGNPALEHQRTERAIKAVDHVRLAIEAAPKLRKLRKRILLGENVEELRRELANDELLDDELRRMGNEEIVQAHAQHMLILARPTIDVVDLPPTQSPTTQPTPK